MKKIAFVFDIPKNMRSRHTEVITKYLHPKIGFDIHYLIDDDTADRVLVRNMTIDLEKLKSDYMFIVPVGAEPFKKLIKHKGGITKYNATMLDTPFTCVPIMNPLVVFINPSMQPKVQECFDTILELYTRDGEVPTAKETDYKFINSVTVAKKYLDSIRDSVVAYDLETTSLDPIEGTIICASFSACTNSAAVIPGVILHVLKHELSELLNTNKIVMHNSKFDMKWTLHEFNIRIKEYTDTMIGHYLFLDQTKGTHSLKNLAMTYTNLSDYSREQDEFVKKFCRTHKVLLKDFSFSMIPVELLSNYACADADATIQLYNNMLIPAIREANPLTVRCFNEILLPAADSLIDAELSGAPVDRSAILQLSETLVNEINEASDKIREFPQVKLYEQANGQLNIQSPAQLGIVLFDYFKFKSVKETATGNNSTDVEVLTALGRKHEFPNMIISIRKLKKLYDTYVTNILELMKANGRVRGNFNLAVTESGRLSSSADGDS